MSWRITLLGRVEAARNGVTISRFESGRAVALLARLALFPKRIHPREELCELLWPEVEPEAARVRLRHNLSVLRKQLEAGLPSGSVIVADRLSVRLNPEAFTTDVAELERTKDKRLYTGELLPGLWDDWILEERYRIEALVDGLRDPAETPVASAPQAPTETIFEPTALSPELARRLSLPPYLTRFIGREAEQDQLRTLLAENRLVTLLGLGGTGKTRLTVEALRERGGTFVALAECVSAAQIPGRIRAALGLPPVETNTLEQIFFAMEGRPLLLALDNMEQLVESGGAEIVELLLSQLPQLTLLVTTRRALNVPGERLIALQPLPREDGVALFLDRAQSVRPGFALTDGNRADVQALCAGLEGIPLALELAASRLRAFSPSELRQELQTRLEWLARTGLKGAKDDRHRSLAAALEWSWRLLSPGQQQFLATLGLFRGGATVAEIGAAADLPDARERLEALVADSLVTLTEQPDGSLYYGLLETVREFVLPRLMDVEAARKRFRTWYIEHPSQEENMAVAWEYALEDSDARDAYALGTMYREDWTGRLGVERAREFLERTLALPAPSPRLRMYAMHAIAECLLRDMKRKEAMALMAEAVAPLEDTPDELLAEALCNYAHICMYDAPQEKTMALLERSRSITKDTFTKAETLRIQGCLLLNSPNFEAAEPLLDAAAELYDKEAPGQRRILGHRAHLARCRKQYEESLRLYQLAVAQARRANDWILVRNAESNLPDILACLGRWQEAVEAVQTCLKTEERHGDRHLMLCILWNFASPLAHLGECERAAKLMSASAALWVREIRPLTEEDEQEVANVRAELARTLDAATLERYWKEGQHLTLKEAIAIARGESIP
ncbi:MAG: hypothetical protein QM758_28685 [Armatimonas sp.]